jgi:hypothetical protein
LIIIKRRKRCVKLILSHAFFWFLIVGNLDGDGFDGDDV